MVVIKECFPTQIDFITSYMEKRRQQMEIMKQRNFKYSSVPREEEIIIPFDDEMTQNTLDNNETVEGSGDMKTPKIIPLDNEPVYVKNFKMFIKHTQCHLDQVLANNRKIDDFHDIVTEIKMPSVNEERLESGADIVEDDGIMDQEDPIEIDDLKSDHHNITKSSPSDDNRGNTSQLKVKKIPNKTGTPKGIQKKHKSARYENDVKIDSFMKDNLVKKVSWRDQQSSSRTLPSKTSPNVKKNLSSSSHEMIISPTPSSSMTTLVQTSNEKLRKLGSSSKISIVEKSSRSFSARPSNSPLNSSRSITRGRDIIKTMSSVGQHKITMMTEYDFKTTSTTAKRDSCSSSVPPVISNKNLVQIPVSIINL